MVFALFQEINQFVLPFCVLYAVVCVSYMILGTNGVCPSVSLSDAKLYVI